jgi:hypothetical protein
MTGDEEEGAALAEGMPVRSEDGVPLGRLAALLIEEDEEEAEFFVLEAGGVERLVPYEAILGVDDGALVVDVPVENVGRFPPVKPDAEPSDEEMQLAYEVFDEGAAGRDGEDADESDDD